MADNEKISDMPFAATPLDGSELIPLVQNGANVVCNPGDIGGGGGITEILLSSPSASLDIVGSPQGPPTATFTLDLPVQSGLAPGGYRLIVANINDKGIIVGGLANGVVGTGDIAASAVTLAKIQNAGANSRILGSGSAGGASPYSEMTVGAGLQIVGTVLSSTITAAINQLTGDVTAGPGSGSQVATLANVGPGAGTTNLANVTIDAKGRVVAISSGEDVGGFIPTLSFGGASVGITYNSNDATYIRVGDLVHIDGVINLSSKGSSVGAATISALPFASAAGRGVINPINYTNIAAALTGGGVSQVNNASTVIMLMVNIAGGNRPAVDTDFTNTTIINFSVTYRV